MAFLTSVERNGDGVSLAPLLARRGHTQWTPDMIYFTDSAALDERLGPGAGLHEGMRTPRR